jgi:hypothetical protein
MERTFKLILKKDVFTRDRQSKAAAVYFRKRWESLPSDYKGKDGSN